MYMKQILGAVSYCHSQGIVHRDLKPENIIFENSDLHSQLRIIDFGCSQKLKPNEKLTDKIGTPYYIAPEILKNCSYNEKCDVWSLGVILYILLSGEPPFNGGSTEGILQNIERQEVQFPERIWSSISKQAKHLLYCMLQKDPIHRLSSKECYAHEWIQKYSFTGQSPNLEVLKKVANFQAQNKIRIAFLQLIAIHLLTPQDKAALSQLFTSLDEDGNGKLTKQELLKGKILSNSKGYSQIVGDPVKAEIFVESIMDQIDQDHTGQIEFSEFVSAYQNQGRDLTKAKIEKVFKLVDIDGNGQITKQEVEAMLGGIPIQENMWKQTLEQCDKNHDGMISPDEFFALIINKVGTNIKM